MTLLAKEVPVKCVLLLSMLLLGGHAWSDVPLPPTPAGTIFGEWLAVFNAADARQVQAFNERHPRHLNSVENMVKASQRSGGMAVLRIEQSEPLRIVVLLQEKQTERALRAEFTASGAESPEFQRLDIKPTDLPPDLAPPRMSQAESLQAVIARADQLAKQDRVSGAILIARDNKVLLEKAWGQANRETGAAATTETQFRLGSLNKMFTATAVLQLVEAGKLSLQDPIGKYFSDYPNKEVASKVTVRHLLTHTGGTGDIFGPEFDANRLNLKEHADYVRLFGARALAFEPGSEDRYSNYGFVLLGVLIEKISGQSYYDFVRERIFQPAGMHSADSLPEDVDVPRRAAGYRRDGDSWKSNASKLPYRGMAAGGGYSTIGDIWRFAQALQSGKLLSKATLAEATRPQNNKQWYGYGFTLLGANEIRSYGHGGGAPGMNADLRIYPELGYVLISLSNLDPPAASMLVDYYALRMPLSSI